jgi:hypothetical protein
MSCSLSSIQESVRETSGKAGILDEASKLSIYLPNPMIART